MRPDFFPSQDHNIFLPIGHDMLINKICSQLHMYNVLIVTERSVADCFPCIFTEPSVRHACSSATRRTPSPASTSLLCKYQASLKNNLFQVTARLALAGRQFAWANYNSNWRKIRDKYGSNFASLAKRIVVENVIIY